MFRLYHFAREAVALPGVLIAAAALLSLFPVCARGQQDSPAQAVIVQPGAPGQASRTLPASTMPDLPQPSPADVAFTQAMIIHHAQAVEMTALIVSRTQNNEVRSLGAKISSSQSDEMRFMERWLAARGEPISLETAGMPDMPSRATAPMPGMLTPEQMEALRKVKGTDFDRLFLTGMIQHHEGALIMVKGLFDSAGAGQDAELFNFATDTDNTQRAEIKIMQKMLEEKR